MCIRDQVAYGGHRMARESGVQVPHDCEIVGIDGNPIFPRLAPWLTSVEILHREFGSGIVELLPSLWGGERPRDHLMSHRIAAVAEI